MFRIYVAWSDHLSVIRHEKATQQDRNKKRFDSADLIYKHPYTRENPVSTSLEHPHSWKLAGFDPGGLPATADGASEVRNELSLHGHPQIKTSNCYYVWCAAFWHG